MILLKSYYNEIRDFVRSLTIVNHWFADDSATAVKTEFNLETLIDAANPYYINICGRYAQGDNVITVVSVDTGATIEFTHANLLDHPKTLTLYRLPSQEFDTLCQRYPNQVDLIKAIVCPVVVNENLWIPGSIDYLHFCGEYDVTDTAITVTSLDDETTIHFTKANMELHPLTKAAYLPPSRLFFDLVIEYSDQEDLIVGVLYPQAPIAQLVDSKHLELVAYSNTILPSMELGVMSDSIREVLTCIRERWTVTEFRYEAYYPAACWSIIWYVLFMRLYAQRLANLRTYSTHPDHVWEYLMSNGLSDYRGILTDDQASFLYRNLRYIMEKSGTQENLQILQEGLLDQLNVILRSKWVVHNLLDFNDDLVRIPEILSHNVGSTDTLMDDFDRGYEAFEVLFGREVDSKLEPEERDDIIAKQSALLQSSKSTSLPTKIIEIERNNTDDRQAFQFMEWTLHTSILLLEQGLLNYSINFRFSELGKNLELTAGETLALIQYVLRDDPPAGYLIPTEFHVRAAWKNGSVNIPETVYLPNVGTVPIANIMDTAPLLSSIEPSITNTTSPAALITETDAQYKILMWHNDQVNMTASALVYQAMQKFRHAVLDIRVVTLDGANALVAGHTTYDAWFAVNGTLNDVVTYYFTSPELKRTLLNTLITNGYPVEESAYSGGAAVTEDKYIAMKALFTQLCSYNVAFIDTNLTATMYPKLKPILVAFHTPQDTGIWSVDPGEVNLTIAESLNTGEHDLQTNTNAVELNGGPEVDANMLVVLDIVTPDTEVALPFAEDGIYDVVIDWGDGTTSTGINRANRTDHSWYVHTYEDVGTYVVIVTGTSTNWLLSDISEHLVDLIVHPSYLYDVGWEDPSFKFYSYNYINIDAVTYKVSLTTMDYMFYDLWL